jgi:hypothetical protein
MKKIILPVDFSDSSDKLVDYAVGFAKDINAEIALIHVAASDIGFVIGDMGFNISRKWKKTKSNMNCENSINLNNALSLKV